MTVPCRKILISTLTIVSAGILPAEGHADPDASVCTFASCANVNASCGQDPITGHRTLTLAIALNNLSRSPATAARFTLAEFSGATVHSVDIASDPDGLDVDLPGQSYSIGAANRNPPGFYRYGNFIPAVAERSDASSPGNYTLVLGFRDLAGNPVTLRNVDVTNAGDDSPANRLPSLGLDGQYAVAAQQSLFGAPGYDGRGPLLYAISMQPIDPAMPMGDCMNVTTPTGKLTEEQLELGPWSIDGVSLVRISYSGAAFGLTMNWEVGDLVDGQFAGKPHDPMSFGSFFIADGPAAAPAWVNSPTPARSALSAWLPPSDGTCPLLGTASRVGALQPVTTCETRTPVPREEDEESAELKRLCVNQLAAQGIQPGDPDGSVGQSASGCSAAAGASPGAGALWALAAAWLLGSRRRRQVRR